VRLLLDTQAFLWSVSAPERLLVAEAIIEELALVSGDEQLGRYPVRVVW
jgi:PIN domain nuclease of toxin-antitoxin system